MSEDLTIWWFLNIFEISLDLNFRVKFSKYSVKTYLITLSVHVISENLQIYEEINTPDWNENIFNGKGLQEVQRHDDVEFKNRFLKGFHLKISYLFNNIQIFSLSLQF